MSNLFPLMAAAGNTGAAVETDANFSDTTLLLQGDTSNESMLYNAFGDASTNAHDITPVGGVHGTSFSPYNESWSVEFDGSGDYLSVSSDTSLAMGTGDFTAECWVYRPASGRGTFFDTRTANDSAGFLVQADSNNKLALFTGGAFRIVDSGTVLPVGEWFHVALVRSSGTTTLYKNGTSVGTYSDSNNYSAGVLTVGSNFGITTEINGSISNLRIVKGTALYTSTFTPSTTPLTDVSGTSLLTCNANRFIDTSSNDHTITVSGDPEIKGFSPFADTDTVTGSGYFDGGEERLSVSGGSSLNFGTGDFTVECWVYPRSFTSPIVFSQIDDGNGRDGVAFGISSSSALWWLFGDGSNWVFQRTPSFSTPLNAWTHLAVTRSGSTAYLFANGVQIDTVSNSTSLSADSLGLTYLGGPPQSGLDLDGNLSDLRVVKGTALYTSAFTPPTSPLTAVSGTSLLTLQNRGANRNIGFIDSSHPTRQITRNGNVTQGSFSPFSQDEGKWGNYFEGSSDYLSVAADSSLAFGTGDLTIEFWVNYASASANYIFYDGRGTAVTNTGIAIFLNGSSVNVNAGTSGLFSETAPSANTWHHIALTRSGTSLRLFVDGTQVGSTVTNSTNFSTNYSVGIGAPLDSTYTASYSLEGYISNLRVVKGTAVYTSNFTPSTEPLTAITNTELLTCQSNRFVDNSSNAHSITVNGNPEVVPFSPFAPSTAYNPATKGGSGYFDGDQDYVRTPSISLGTDFIIEGWFYRSDGSDSIVVSNQTTPGSVSDNHQIIRFGYPSNNDIMAYFGGTTLSASNVNEIAPGQWFHYAISRDSLNNVYAFVNGIQKASGSSSNAIGFSTIGIFDYGTSPYQEFTGYVSDLRVRKGITYTSAFTPPTAPLTKTDSTVFLCNFTNAGIYDGTGRNVLETVGDAHVENSVKKYGTGSMEFDGSGDYLTVPPTNLFEDIQNGAFTIEAWINIADNNNRGFFHLAEQYFDNYANGYVVGQNGTDRLFVTHSGGFTQQASIGYSLNTWFHIALVRNSSGTLKLFVDGIEKISVTDTTSSATTHLLIGGYYTTSNLMKGFIDDFRITKGVARYTAAFTPPEAKLPNL